MLQILEQFTAPKSPHTPSEDALVVTAHHAAVIDGATPKTSFRYPGGVTPGLLAAQLLADAIRRLPPDVTAHEAVRHLTAALHQPDVRPSDRPIASCVIYSAHHRQLWLIGDCQAALLTSSQAVAESSAPNNASSQAAAESSAPTDDSIAAPLPAVTFPKRIDALLADWRRAVITSLLSRGIRTPEEILADDPGRRIIQPHITRQVRYQNLASPHRLAYCMLDGEPIPEHFIHVLPVAADVRELILASDGYPALFPTLAATEAHLQALLARDPLCIGPLLGTKGIRPGNASFDDRTYLRLKIS